MEGSAPPAVHIVRVWLVTPPLVGVSHPKSAILRLANAQRGALALRARKVTAAGAMRVIARGVSEIVAAFRSGLHKKVQELWKCSELEVTAEDRAELEGGGCLIQPSASAVAGGAGSSGGLGFPPAAAASEASSVDTGSNASSALIVQEVKLEREREPLTVHVEPGMADGHEITFFEEGEPMVDGEPGDLKFRIRTLPHAAFRRTGNDLHMNATIPLLDALVGFSRNVSHLDGHVVVLATPGVTRPGDVQRVPGEGMPLAQHPERRGDLFVTYTVDFPAALSEEQKAAARALLGNGAAPAA